METKEKLKKILVEWSEHKIPAIYRRDFDMSLLKGGEVLSIIGARRTGKTFLCYQIINELRKSVPHDNVIYINLEDERLHPLNGSELSELWDVCLELFSIRLDKTAYLFVDEIQNASLWSKWARRITDQNKNLKLIMTGSSSKLMSRDIATELRGRALSHTVYPLSFSEYIRANGSEIEDAKRLLYSNERIKIKKQFGKYFRRGGFPATVQSELPNELLKEYFSVMFYKDLIERHKVKNIRLFEDYLTLLVDQTSSLFSISATSGKLAQFGHSLSKNTLSNFSKYIEDAFIVFEVRKFSQKIKEQLKAPRKIYAIDHGLVQAVRFAFSEDYGRILENIVFLALKRQDKKIFYHSGTRECDFLIMDDNRVEQAIQVTKSVLDPKTLKRETEGLIEAMQRHNLKEGMILTEDNREDIKVDRGHIKVLPVWYWLLGLK